MTPLGAALAHLSRGKIAISASIAARNLKLGRCSYMMTKCNKKMFGYIGSSYMSHLPSFRFLAVIGAEIAILPLLRGASAAPRGVKGWVN